MVLKRGAHTTNKSPGAPRWGLCFSSLVCPLARRRCRAGRRSAGGRRCGNWRVGDDRRTAAAAAPVTGEIENQPGDNQHAENDAKNGASPAHTAAAAGIGRMINFAFTLHDEPPQLNGREGNAGAMPPFLEKSGRGVELFAPP